MNIKIAIMIFIAIVVFSIWFLWKFFDNGDETLTLNSLKKLKIDLLLVPAVFWKNKFDNLPIERKEQKEFMMNKFSEFTGKIADSDDVADAYMMLKACLGGIDAEYKN